MIRAHGSRRTCRHPRRRPRRRSSWRSRGSPSTVSNVLLLTGGLANQGETNHDVLAARAAELQAAGVRTTTFGLGADFDEQLLSRMAAAGGGQFYYIEQAAQIADVFASELGETLEVVARDVRLVVSGEAMSMTCLNGFASRQLEAGPDGSAELDGGRSFSSGTLLDISLGDMVADQQITVAIAVRVPASALGTKRSAAVRVADRDGRLYPEPFPVEWHVVDDAQDARLRALAANRHGDFRNIRSLGPMIGRVTSIADALEAEVNEFEAVMDLAVAKQRHYESRNIAFSRSAQGKARK